MEEDLENAQREMEELIRELEEKRPRLFDVKELDARSLLVWDETLRFWCADTVIRIMLNIGEPLGEKKWLELYRAAHAICARLNPYILAMLLHLTGDHSGIKGLIILHLSRSETLHEIVKLINAIPVLRSFLNLLDAEEDRDFEKSQEAFDKFTRDVIKKFNRAQKKLRNLNIHVDKYEYALKTKTGNIREIENYKEIKQEIGLNYNILYATGKADAKWDPSAGLPFAYVRNPVAAKQHLRIWDLMAPEIWEKEVGESLKYLSPLNYKEEWKGKHLFLEDAIFKMTLGSEIKIDRKTYFAKKKKLNPEDKQNPDIKTQGFFKKNTYEPITTVSLYGSNPEDNPDIITDWETSAETPDYQDNDEMLMSLVLLERMLREIVTEANAKNPEELVKKLMLFMIGLIDDKTQEQAAEDAGIPIRTAKLYFAKIKDKAHPLFKSNVTPAT